MNLAFDLFKALAAFLKKHYRSEYIVLIDEYDVLLVRLQDKPWEAEAQGAYIRLLSLIFKAKIELLIEKAKEENVTGLGADSPSDAKILETMKAWYEGYRIGRLAGRFNPVASVSFLIELSKPLPLHLAARPFWTLTGNRDTIAQVALKNRAIVGEMAFHLIREYKDASLPAAYVVRNRNLPVHGPVSDSANSITLCASDLPDSLEFSDEPLNELITMLLYTGYLTLRSSNTIKIPNGELLVKVAIEGEGGSALYEWRLVIPGKLVGRENPASVTIGFGGLDPKKPGSRMDTTKQAYKVLNQIITTEYTGAIPHTHRRVDWISVLSLVMAE
ncbi:hypothetical protein EV179_005858 [Coemansia sp. RSA 487]|nr:hypothetical protein EV179_005858 [Coemansia sp. RSA 487]